MSGLHDPALSTYFGKLSTSVEGYPFNIGILNFATKPDINCYAQLKKRLYATFVNNLHLIIIET